MPCHRCYGKKYFIEAQGYGIDDDIMYQDNLSAMLLETEGKKSITKKKNHIQVRYFFIKDWIATGNVELKHFPATKFLAGHFQKPLQGEIFHKFREELIKIS